MIFLKPFLPYIFASVGVAAAGVTGYVVLEPTIFPKDEEAPAIVEQVEPETQATEEQVASLTPEPEEEEVAIVVPQAPVFTLLRVEKDGSTVVAGEAPANSRVSIYDAGEKIAELDAGNSGDFAHVFDNPLTPGVHELSLVAKLGDGTEIVSTELGIIDVPNPDQDQSATVLVSDAGEASRILQKPEPEPVTETVAAVEPEAEEVAAPEPNSQAEVFIEAADIDGSKLFIAGKGTVGQRVNIYLDGEFLGSTIVTPNGAFLFEGERKLSAGRYEIRADMLDGTSTNVVIARAQVDLVHEPVVAQVDVPEASAPEEEVAEVAEVSEPTGEPENTIEIRTGSAVIIRRGDSLWHVAQRNYGSGIRYTTIFEANRGQIANPDLIYPGQVFNIPQDQASENKPSSG